jgi:cytidylate kinase
MSPSRLRVVTVSRQYGSGGARIAARVASRLGFKLLDRALLEQAARTAQCDPAVAEKLDEHLDGWAHQVARSLWRGAFEQVGPDAGVLDAERMAQLNHRLIAEAAALGECVIVGRGAPCLLRERPDAFHAFVYAPRAERIERLRGRVPAGSDPGRVMDDFDQARAAYVQGHFGCRWDDPALYDLMVSTRAGEDVAAEVILAALAAFDRPPAAP